VQYKHRSLLFHAFQVDVDLAYYTRGDLSGLKVEVGNEGVQVLPEWDTVSRYWEKQLELGDSRLQVFVKVREQGECE
jgi:hypothetical protein